MSLSIDFNEYRRVHKNFMKCMNCLEEIMVIATSQNNIEIGKKVEELLKEIEKVDQIQNPVV